MAAPGGCINNVFADMACRAGFVDIARIVADNQKVVISLVCGRFGFRIRQPDIARLVETLVQMAALGQKQRIERLGHAGNLIVGCALSFFAGGDKPRVNGLAHGNFAPDAFDLAVNELGFG